MIRDANHHLPAGAAFLLLGVLSFFLPAEGGEWGGDWGEVLPGSGILSSVEEADGVEVALSTTPPLPRPEIAPPPAPAEEEGVLLASYEGGVSVAPLPVAVSAPAPAPAPVPEEKRRGMMAAGSDLLRSAALFFQERPGRALSRREAATWLRDTANMPVDAAAPSAPKDPAYCLALAIYFEARSEPVAGQRAVGDVILNRMRADAYPDTICGVVFQGGQRRHACQFSFLCDGLSDRPYEQGAWEQALRLAREMLRGGGGSRHGDILHYHAEYVEPEWARSMSERARIGKHVFYGGDGRL